MSVCCASCGAACAASAASCASCGAIIAAGVAASTAAAAEEAGRRGTYAPSLKPGASQRTLAIITIVISLAALALAIAAAMAHSLAFIAAAAPIFPNVTGKNLNGKTFQLPHDFAAPVSLVFVAFERRQQSDVDSWKPFADELRAKHPHLGVYELPVLSKSYTLFRGFIDGGMRSGIPSPSVRASTITLYIDKRPFDTALGIGSEHTIHVLLVKPSGEILWQTTGRFDAAHPPELDALLGEGV